jgi:hypothetical protein
MVASVHENGALWYPTQQPGKTDVNALSIIVVAQSILDDRFESVVYDKLARSAPGDSGACAGATLLRKRQQPPASQIGAIAPRKGERHIMTAGLNSVSWVRVFAQAHRAGEVRKYVVWSSGLHQLLEHRLWGAKRITRTNSMRDRLELNG